MLCRYLRGIGPSPIAKGNATRSNPPKLISAPFHCSSVTRDISNVRYDLVTRGSTLQSTRWMSCENHGAVAELAITRLRAGIDILLAVNGSRAFKYMLVHGLEICCCDCTNKAVISTRPRSNTMRRMGDTADRQHRLFFWMHIQQILSDCSGLPCDAKLSTVFNAARAYAVKTSFQLPLRDASYIFIVLSQFCVGRRKPNIREREAQYFSPAQSCGIHKHFIAPRADAVGEKNTHDHTQSPDSIICCDRCSSEVRLFMSDFFWRVLQRSFELESSRLLELSRCLRLNRCPTPDLLGAQRKWDLRIADQCVRDETTIFCSPDCDNVVEAKELIISAAAAAAATDLRSSAVSAALVLESLKAFETQNSTLLIAIRGFIVRLLSMKKLLLVPFASTGSKSSDLPPVNCRRAGVVAAETIVAVASKQDPKAACRVAEVRMSTVKDCGSSTDYSALVSHKLEGATNGGAFKLDSSRSVLSSWLIDGKTLVWLFRGLTFFRLVSLPLLTNIVWIFDICFGIRKARKPSTLFFEPRKNHLWDNEWGSRQELRSSCNVAGSLWNSIFPIQSLDLAECAQALAATARQRQNIGDLVNGQSVKSPSNRTRRPVLPTINNIGNMLENSLLDHVLQLGSYSRDSTAALAALLKSLMVCNSFGQNNIRILRRMPTWLVNAVKTERRTPKDCVNAARTDIKPWEILFADFSGTQILTITGAIAKLELLRLRTSPSWYYILNGCISEILRRHGTRVFFLRHLGSQERTILNYRITSSLPLDVDDSSLGMFAHHCLLLNYCCVALIGDYTSRMVHIRSSIFSHLLLLLRRIISCGVSLIVRRNGRTAASSQSKYSDNLHIDDSSTLQCTVSSRLRPEIVDATVDIDESIPVVRAARLSYDDANTGKVENVWRLCMQSLNHSLCIASHFLPFDLLRECGRGGRMLEQEQDAVPLCPTSSEKIYAWNSNTKEAVHVSYSIRTLLPLLNLLRSAVALMEGMTDDIIPASSSSHMQREVYHSVRKVVDIEGGPATRTILDSDVRVAGMYSVDIIVAGDSMFDASARKPKLHKKCHVDLFSPRVPVRQLAANCEINGHPQGGIWRSEEDTTAVK